MRSFKEESRSQVGIGTLAVFIAMVLVALIAGGVLIETTGVLQGKSVETGQQSTSQVTDRVGVESAIASYSSGNMQRIDIVLSKAPGSGDIDLSEMVVHWLGANGSTELTGSTFSITPIKGSGTVLTDRADRMNVSNFGKTIPDGTPTTVRFLTANGATTTVVLRTPEAPPTNGDVSLLWKSPSGNPASGTGSATSTPSSPESSIEWTYDAYYVDGVAAESGTSLYVSGRKDYDNFSVRKLDPSDGSLIQHEGWRWQSIEDLAIDDNDQPVYRGESTDNLYRWDPTENTTTRVYNHTRSGWYNRGHRATNNDLYVVLDNMSTDSGEFVRREPNGGQVWNHTETDDRGSQIATTDNAVYGTTDASIFRYDHNGNQQWSTNIGDIDGLAVGPTHVYVSHRNPDGITQLYKANGTETSFSHTTVDTVFSMDVGPENYLYLADHNLTILDADGNVTHTHDFTYDLYKVEVRTDGTYIVDRNDQLFKLDVRGLP